MTCATGNVVSWLNRSSGHRAVLIFFIWALWLSLEYLALGPFSYVRIPENANIHIPARLSLARDISLHNVGYWVPEWAGGVDRLSELMACSLDTVLFVFLPGWLAYGLFMLLQRFVAGYFFFRLVKDQLRLSALPALYAGLAYTLLSHEVFGGASDNFTLYDGFVVPAVPLVLWFLWRLDSRGIRSVVFAFIVGIVFASTGAFPISGFVLPLVFLWFAFVSPPQSRKPWVFILFFFLGWTLASLPFLWATGINAIQSHRATGLTASWLSNLLLVLRLGRDNAISLLLAIWGLVATRGRERHLRAIFTFMSAFFVFLLLSPILYGVVRSSLGFVAGFSFDRFYIFIPFFAVACAALGLEHVAQSWNFVHAEDSRVSPVRARSVLAITAIGMVLWQSVLLKQETLWEMKSGSNYAAIFQRPEILELRKQTLKDPPFRVVTAGDHPAYAWAYGLETADGYLALYPKRYQEYWNGVLEPVLAETPGLSNFTSGNLIQLFTPEATRSSQYGFQATTPFEFDHYYNLNLLSLANVRFVISSVPLESSSLKLLSSTSRVRQSAWSEASRFGAFLAMLKGAPPGPPIYVYENSDVFPRFFLTGKIKVSATSSEELETMRMADAHTLRSTAFVETDVASGADLARITGDEGNVSLMGYSADKIELSTVAESDKILVITNNYNRFWKASLDGLPVRTFPVDHAFQGLALPAGKHNVLLHYEPPYGGKF